MSVIPPPNSKKRENVSFFLSLCIDLIILFFFFKLGFWYIVFWIDWCPQRDWLAYLPGVGPTPPLRAHLRIACSFWQHILFLFLAKNPVCSHRWLVRGLFCLVISHVPNRLGHQCTKILIVCSFNLQALAQLANGTVESNCTVESNAGGIPGVGCSEPPHPANFCFYYLGPSVNSSLIFMLNLQIMKLNWVK